jgi:hypothetical protein
MLVEPPIAVARRTAFSMPFWLMIIRAVMPCSTNATICRPAACADRRRAACVAGIVALPGKLIPIASATQHIVFAVPRNEHEPQVGVAQSSKAWYCASSIFPAINMPNPSVSEVASAGRSSNVQPPSIGPPTTTIAGTSSRAAAISIPGTILSHEQRSTTASSWCACTIISTSLAIKSRLGRM